MNRINKYFITFVLVITSGCEKGNNSYWRDDYTYVAAAQKFQAEYVALVNSHRRSLGLSPITPHDALSEIALSHSTHMANGKVSFGHTGFSTRCTESKIALGGGNFCAENVAMGQNNAAAVFESWIKSSGHRANIENSRITHTGLGYKQSINGVYYWTQIFIEFNQEN